MNAVAALLSRTLDTLGIDLSTHLLNIDQAQVLRWIGETEPISAEMRRRIFDLHNVLTRILRVYPAAAVSLWLVGSEPLLSGARPIDVLALEGAAPVLRAIDGIAQGAHA